MSIMHQLTRATAVGLGVATLRRPGVSRIATLFIFGVSCAAGAAFLPPPALAQQGKASHGTASVPAAQQVDMSALPQLAPGAAAATKSPPRPMDGGSDAAYAARKAAAAKNFRGPSGPTGAPPSQPQADLQSPTGQETPGATPVFVGQSEAGTIRPSDMALAVSPTNVVQVVNSSIAVYTKTGALVAGFPKALSTFFPGSSGDLGDVRAFYDWRIGRFVVVADDFTFGVIRLAASATSNPAGSWHLYTLNVWGTGNCRGCVDFPQLGFDNNFNENDSTIYLGVNFFPASAGVSDYMLLLPKAKIYAGAGFGFNFWFNLSWNGVLVDTVHPVTMMSGAEHPRAGFAVQSFNINFGGTQCRTGCNGLVVWAFSNNLQKPGSPGPELSAVSVGTGNNYFLPASANEPGCAFCIDTGDVRISGTPIYHAGVISASLNTNGSDGHSHTLWFQLRPQLNDNDARCTGAFLNACPQVIATQLLNEDCYFCGGQGAAGSTFYGTLAPDDGGDLTMVFGYSDNNINPESAYVSRRVTQTLNTMHDNGIVLCGGASQYLQGRWGDYTAAVSDISLTTQNYLWISAMNSIAGGNWGTCIGRNGFTSPLQP